METTPRPGLLHSRRKELVLLALTLVAYLAAVNRAQPFLWLIPALLSATLITGLAWPRWLLKGIAASRTCPQHAEEGESIRLGITVRNRGLLPRFMIELVDHLPFTRRSSRETTARHLGMLAYLPAGKERRLDLPVVCERRGFYRLGPLDLASGFPLGLCEARTSCGDDQATLTIYPRLFAIAALPLKGTPSEIHRGACTLPEGSGAAEFSVLREYRRGDSPRHIHWPTSARQRELMVREYEPLASPRLHFLLDQNAAANVGDGKEATFEYAVRIAASMARAAAQQNIHFRLSGDGMRALRWRSGTGERHFRAILEELAVVAGDGTRPYAALLNESISTSWRGETAVVFLAGPPDQWPLTRQALAALRASGLHIFAIVFDRPSFAAAAGTPPAPGTTPLAMAAALIELGAHTVVVRQGDDLARLFDA